MRRILFEQTDFASLPNPPAGFSYIGFNGATFSQKDDGGSTTQPGGGLVQLTYTEALDLLDAQGVKEGTRYLITGFDIELYGGTDILVDGLPSNQFSSDGYGRFYNPNYNKHSTWDSANTYVANDIVIYGGKIWKNLTGSTGSTNSIFALDDTNWELQSDYTNTYITVWDKIEIGWGDGNYCINSRLDSFRNNYVRVGQLGLDGDRWFFCGVNPIAAFSWGNNNVTDCTVIDSYFNCLNIINTEIYGIKFENYSFVFDLTFKNSYIESWIFTNESGIYGGTIENCQFTNITLDNNSTMYGSIYGGSFNDISLNNSSEMNNFDVYNSYFSHINLDNSSSISSVSATNSYYELINMTNDSWTDSFTLDNSSIRRIDLSNRSYMNNIYLYSNSEMYEVNLDNYSYIEGYGNNIRLYGNSSMTYVSLNNHCRISGSIGLTNSSYFKRIDMTNRSIIQDSITLDNSYIEKLDSTNDSYIYNLNFTNSHIINLDIKYSNLQNHILYNSDFDEISINNSYFSDMGLSSSHISTINSYGSNISNLDLSSTNLNNMNVDRSYFSDLTRETGTLYQLDLNTFYLNLLSLGTYSNTFPSGSSFRFNELKYQFSVNMDGSYGKGLADSELTIPNMLIPNGYYIEKIILDTTSNLVADTLPDLNFGVFDEFPSLLGFNLSTLTSVKVFDLNNQLSGNKAGSDTTLYAALSGGTDITSGTITMEITLKKTYDYNG